MAVGLERLILLITADAKGAIAGIEATGAAATSNLGAVQTQSAAASRGMLAIGAAGVAAGAVAAKGLGDAVGAVEDVGKDVLKIQRLTGESAEGASKLRFEAQQTGVPIDKLATSLAILSTKGAELAKIGVALKGADGAARPFNDVLGDIAQKIASLPAGQKRVELARDLFGRGGADLLPLLQRGRDGLEALQTAAEKFGVVLSQDTLDNVKRNIVATREWQATWEGLKLQVGNELLPAVTSVSEEVTGLAKSVASIPGLGPLLADVAAVGTGLGIVGGGATLAVAAAAKVKATWSQLPSVFRASAEAEQVDTDAKLANAKASDLAAAAAERLKVATAATATATEAKVAATVAPATQGAVVVASESALFASGAAAGGKSKAAVTSAELASQEAREAAATRAAAAELNAYGSAAAVIAEEKRLAAVATEQLAAAELEEAAAAQKAAASEAELRAAQRGGGVVGSGLGTASLALFAVPVAASLANAITGSADDIDQALKRLQAQAAAGGRDLVKSFADSAKAEAEDTSWVDVLEQGLASSVGVDLKQSRQIAFGFQLGGKGERQTADTFKDTFKRSFDSQVQGGDTSRAQAFLDQLKSEDKALDHNSTTYKRSEQLRREWQKELDLVTATQKANTGVTDDQAGAVDRLGHTYDNSKSAIANWAEGFSNIAGIASSAISATQAVSDAQQKLIDDDKKIAELKGGSAPDGNAIASASDKVASSRRSEAEAQRQLTQTGHDLADAKAELARIDRANDPARYAAAEARVADATDARAGAVQGLADAQGQAASSQRDLSSAQSDAVKSANDLANAQERIASATRSQAAARRELDNANRDLAEKQAELAHVDPKRDPNRFRQLSGEVADLRDSQANARDRVADADASKRQSERDLIGLRAEAKAKTDELADAERQRAQDSDALITAIIQQNLAQAALFDTLKANPDAIPALVGQIKDWAAKAGGDAPAAAQAWIDKLNGIAFTAGIAGKALDDMFAGQGAQALLGGAISAGVDAAKGAFAHPKAAASPSGGRQASGNLLPPQLPLNAKKGHQERGRDGHLYSWDGQNWDLIPGKAKGGIIPGVGSEDSELIRAMPGEFVITKDSVAKYGVGFMEMVNTGSLPKFATGGLVGDGSFATAKDLGSWPVVPSADNGRVEALLAQAVALLGERKGGDTHVHVDQTNYERPPSPGDTSRAVRAGMFLAGRR